MKAELQDVSAGKATQCSTCGQLYMLGHVHRCGEGDPVNSPAHYTTGEIECIDAIRSKLGEDGFRAFCQGNAMKYIWRADQRTVPRNSDEDIRKAIWYLRMSRGDDPRK